MDHEVVPRLCKISNWLLNSFQDRFGLHQGKNVRVSVEFEVPKKTYFKACIIHRHGAIGFAMGEVKEVLQ